MDIFEAAQVIQELIELAREMREVDARGEQLGLTEEELAFYDALETNDSAVAVLGDADRWTRSKNGGQADASALDRTCSGPSPCATWTSCTSRTSPTG